MHALRSVLPELEGFLFPPRCWGCGRPLMPTNGFRHFMAELLCGTCLEEVTITGENGCLRCGQPGVGRRERCSRCGILVGGFDRAAAGALYGGVVRGLVLRLKFGGEVRAAFPLGRLAYRGACRALGGRVADGVVAVPLHPIRQWSRGYNQAERIGRHVADALGIPFIPGGLRRVRNTPPQGTGGGGSRRQNVKGAFAPVRDGPGKLLHGEVPISALSGLHVLLVDDVLSTGSTLDACGQVLLDEGVSRVTAATSAT